MIAAVDETELVTIETIAMSVSHDVQSLKSMVNLMAPRRHSCFHDVQLSQHRALVDQESAAVHQKGLRSFQ